jgi:tRNA-dihydrouridine synthase B
MSAEELSKAPHLASPLVGGEEKHAPFRWDTTGKPIIALAPMAGVTDASYRQLIKKIAPEVVVFTEFLSTDAICYGAQKTMDMLAFDASIERPFIVQVFGAEPDHFLKACAIIEQMGADGIDINMGCPAAKIVSSCYGSALIRRPDLAAELVAAAVKAVKIPVSVKTRLGWDTHETLIPFCQKMVEAGASALSIHGRRYHDKFTGKANWDPIYELKKNISVPVIGNGDIASAQDAVDKIQNLDGVMVGRGTFGNPWVMREIVDALQSGKAPAKREWTPEEKLEDFRSKVPFILEHCELSVRIKGEKRGVLEMRRHLSSYVKGFDGAKELRIKVLTMEKFDDVKAALAV